MERYSYTFSFIPRPNMAGAFMFYFTVNRWVDERCVSSHTVAEVPVKSIPESPDFSQTFANGMHMSDLAYQLVSQTFAERNRPSSGEVNARPASPSVPS